MKGIKSKIYKFQDKIGERITFIESSRDSFGSKSNKKGLIVEKEIEKYFNRIKELIKVIENDLWQEYKKAIKKSKENSTLTFLYLKNYNKSWFKRKNIK